MSIFNILNWPIFKRSGELEFPTPDSMPPIATTDNPGRVRRHFYNEHGFQTYASFFPLWGGWMTAGHVLNDASQKWPDFIHAHHESAWPGGLDAAVCDCNIPKVPPAHPRVGQDVVIYGYPAGSRHLEKREGTVYIERNAGGGQWIAHIKTPDEPVVSGMSGGPVLDAKTLEPIGVVITRNSPADLNNDRDPDESCDFVSIRAVWDALQQQAVA